MMHTFENASFLNPSIGVKNFSKTRLFVNGTKSKIALFDKRNEKFVYFSKQKSLVLLIFYESLVTFGTFRHGKVQININQIKSGALAPPFILS